MGCVILILPRRNASFSLLLPGIAPCWMGLLKKGEGLKKQMESTQIMHLNHTGTKHQARL